MLTEVLVMLIVIVFISVVVLNTAGRGRKEKLNFFDSFSVVVITTAVVYFGYQIFWR